MFDTIILNAQHFIDVSSQRSTPRKGRPLPLFLKSPTPQTKKNESQQLTFTTRCKQ